MLGNGYCTRPVELDCAVETICEGVHLLRHHHGVPPDVASTATPSARPQTGRATIFENVLDDLDPPVAPIA